MEKIAPFKTAFFAELDKVMIPMGFKYVKSRYGYVIKNRNDWELHVMVICTKWSASISIDTKIGAINNRVAAITEKITGRKTELNIWGGFETISKHYLEQQDNKYSFMCYTDVDTTSAPRKYFCSSDILQLAHKWITDFEKVGKPFFDRITTEKDFALNTVRNNSGFFFPDKALSLPILCRLFNMDKNEIASVCEKLESEFADFKTKAEQADVIFKKWTDNYYKVKQAVLNNNVLEM